jgi:hypothetical protein
MIYTDGTTSRYAVMRGRMKGRSFDGHSADIVAVYTLVGSQPDYRAMTAKHATKDAPAVRWQA